MGWVQQDVDDTDGDGPETDTIDVTAGHGFVPGSYHVWVHNFTQGTFTGSGARLVITGANTAYTFQSTGASGNPNDDIWHIADITISDGGNIALEHTYQDFEPGGAGTIL